MIFKVGDRVKYTSNYWAECTENPLWNGAFGQVAGTIESFYKNEDADILTDMVYNVVWDNGRENTYREMDLELISRPCHIHVELPDEMFEISL